MRRHLLALFLAMLLPVAAGCVGTQEAPIPDNFYGDDIYPAVLVEPFVLQNQDSDFHNSSVMEGKVSIVVFMFTRCPDVCPVVSANVRWVSTQLTVEEMEQIELISITVDPWSDGPQELYTYRQNLSLEWNHYTGSVDDLEPVWGNFGVGLQTYSNETDDNGTQGRHHPNYDYLVDHSTGTILVDKQMRQRVWWGDTDWAPELVLSDVRELLAE